MVWWGWVGCWRAFVLAELFITGQKAFSKSGPQRPLGPFQTL